MKSGFQQRLECLRKSGAGPALRGGRRGVEKECLRVTPDGGIAGTPHPQALGSALTHPYITTDYSEALLEFVTPPVGSSWEALQFLVDLHQFTVASLQNELLWAASMPCAMTSDSAVPIARYGTSNVGTLKHVYRRGLGHRYGRIMQTIAGVHFNYSIDDAVWNALRAEEGSTLGRQAFVSASYFRMLRNFRRFGWLVLYLFGCSPAVCRSFLQGGDAGLESFDRHTLFAPHATSLRMSDIGYKNKAQSQVEVSLDSLEAYVRDLRVAITTPFAPYAAIGVLRDGEYRQLNANLLQIENEFYSSIRPKRVVRSGERPSDALESRGVEYVELRSVDVNLFDPAGINQAQIRFLELFVQFCMLSDGPPLSADEARPLDANLSAIARRGREPGLVLARTPSDGGTADTVKLQDWAQQILQAMLEIAAVADAGTDDSAYTVAVQQQLACVRDPELTPSARVLSEMRDNGESFFEFGMRMSRSHTDYFRSIATVNEELRRELADEAHSSMARQKAIEDSDELSFDDYLARYLAGTLQPCDRGGPPAG